MAENDTLNKHRPDDLETDTLYEFESETASPQKDVNHNYKDQDFSPLMKNPSNDNNINDAGITEQEPVQDSVRIFLTNMDLIKANQVSAEVIQLRSRQKKNSNQVNGEEEDNDLYIGQFGIKECFFDRTMNFSHKFAINEVVEENDDDISEKSDINDNKTIPNNSMDPTAIQKLIRKYTGNEDKPKMLSASKRKSIIYESPKASFTSKNIANSDIKPLMVINNFEKVICFC